jgi:hypothetical protein
MEMKKIQLKGKKWEALGAILLAAAFIIPALSFASTKTKLYVNGSVLNSGNGSIDRPYKTISQALSVSAKNTEVHVANGTYIENIVIPKGVSVFGENKDSVRIIANTNDDPTVVMKDNSKINKVTIEKGEIGIRVDKDSKASIIKVVVKDSKHDGIKIKDGGDDNDKVSITDSTIKNNDKSGIYAKDRRVVLINNDIHDNDNDGVVFDAGVKAWVEKNTIKDNDGSGIRVVLDDADVWTKKNTIRDNGREGVEIDAFGRNGRVDLNGNKFNSNDNFAVAKIQRSFFNASVWNGLTVENSTFTDSAKGKVSPVIRIIK